MIIRPLNIIFSVGIISMLSGCGGTLISGGNVGTKKSEKNESKTATQSDGDMASDPQVVTGAYLACEVAPAEMGSTSDNEAIGCNIMSNGKRVVESKEHAQEFSGSYKGNKIAPSSKNTSSSYAALFLIPKPQVAETTFTGQILGSGGKSMTCTSTTLPCTSQANRGPSTGAGLTLTTIGLWQYPINLSSFPLNDDCPVSASLFCDENGRLSSTSPESKLSKETSCLGNNPTIINTIGALFGKAPSPAMSFKLDSSSCVVKKRSQRGGNLKYIVTGEGCSVLTVDSKGTLYSVILSNSSTANSSQLEQQLSGYACH